jgi:hypothetical protein
MTGSLIGRSGEHGPFGNEFLLSTVRTGAWEREGGCTIAEEDHLIVLKCLKSSPEIGFPGVKIEIEVVRLYGFLNGLLKTRNVLV